VNKFVLIVTKISKIYIVNTFFNFIKDNDLALKVLAGIGIGFIRAVIVVKYDISFEVKFQISHEGESLI